MKLYLSIAATALLVFCCFSPLKSQNNFLIKFPIRSTGITPKIAVDGQENFLIIHTEINGHFLLKYSSQNALVYHKKLDLGESNSCISAIAAASNGNVFITGSKTDSLQHVSRFIAIANTNGDILWTKLFDSGYPDIYTDNIVITNSDKAFVQFRAQHSLSYVLIDQSGNYSCFSYQHPNAGPATSGVSAVKCSNGDIICVSTTNNLQRFDENGQLLWSNTPFNPDTTIFFDNQPCTIIELPTGEFIIGGTCAYISNSDTITQAGSYIKTDANGQVLDFKVYNSNHFSCVGSIHDLQITGTNELSFSTWFQQNAFFGKMNFNGDLTEVYKSAYTYQQTEFTGQTFRYRNGIFYYANFMQGDTSGVLYISKNDQLDNLLCDLVPATIVQQDLNLNLLSDISITSGAPITCTGTDNFSALTVPIPVYYDCSDTQAPLTVETSQMKKELSVYPNPASNFVNISNENAITCFQLYSTDGRLLVNKRLNSPLTQINIDLSDFAQGVFVIRITDINNQQKIQKLIIE